MKKFIFLIFFFLFLFFPQITRAEVIHNFDTQIVAHKNGVMDITETINYDFESLYRHGIYRYIPTFAKVGDLYRIYKIENVKVLRDGKSEDFSTTYTNEQISFKIGNADKEITGAHTYQISYSVQNGIGSNFEDHDEIYWNTTGNGWQVNIEKATAKVDTDFGLSPTKVICYQGLYGSKDTSCLVAENIVSIARVLNSSEGLTIITVYPVGTFPKSILSKSPPTTIAEKIFALIWKNYFYIFILINFGIGGYLIYWYQKHKNKKRFGPPSVNFDIPKDELGKSVAPALAGTIDTAKLERDDITATIFDLAIRKYIKLEGKKTVRSLLPDSTEQIITKIKDDGKLLPFEKSLFKRLFRDGNSVNVSSLKTDFYKTFQSMEDQVFSILVKKGYYSKNPKNQKAGLIVLGMVTLFTGNIILAVILFFLAKKLNGRTSLGDEMDYRIDGLKLFLKSMDRNYKWQAKNFYTVEQMIPYAVALGYIDKFMEALKILKPDYNPSWYSGSGNFYASYAVFSAASLSSFTTSAPSSSSGSSGGFSGGGGGGGGGGSW